MSLKGKTIRYNLHVNFKFIWNKNAFQWDAYRPLQWPSREVSAHGGVHPRGQTDVCENITFPQLLLRTVNIDTTTQDGGCLGQ